MTQPSGRIVLRADVPEWLLDHYGALAKVTDKTLAKLHWAGTGPRAVKFGSRIGHYESDLHAWVRQRMALVTSSSDPGQAPEAA
jgi:hypothetical protein